MHSNKQSYISILTTDAYLPGALVLYHSLQHTQPQFPFKLLITTSISSDTIHSLEKHNVPFECVGAEIKNPTDVSTKHRWFPTYSKLYTFGQTAFEKVVYLDIDMLVLENIDELFLCENMSATNAGGMLPRKKSWKHMNSGLMVIEPSQEIFDDMMKRIGAIEPLVSGGTSDRPTHGSDQDFINAYFTDWSNSPQLHLDHTYNMIHYYLDEYHQLFGYDIAKGTHPVKILHYASYLKPWNMSPNELSQLQQDTSKKLEYRAIQLWQTAYEDLNNIR